MIGAGQNAIDLSFKIGYDNKQTYVCRRESEDEEDKNTFPIIVTRILYGGMQ